MIHVIITTANIAEAYDSRKAQYIESIEACLQYQQYFDSYTVLECVSANEQYLDAYNTHYSTLGNPFPNKGLNEMSHLKGYLENAVLPNDAAIIKLSGKYVIEDYYFFEKVAKLKDEFDSLFKNDNDVYVGNGYHTFFYYMKKGLFLDTINSLEFSVGNIRPIEWDVKSYLMVNERHAEIDRLGLIARQGTNSEKIFRC
ncbi:hypothetical protein [Mucilaginibacter gilvus]|uniref:Uncharacterized protein n=1 Tax=Mucilaginibacter gilvus TaxID=2305909 RepID=A0A444MT40_9SPHI|nr:hypothetical protein [Mucilaginibacter gilvus]RWY55789.1 hypothetical protein EPL05_05280 [Mucilaginibacter gilvus]